MPDPLVLTTEPPPDPVEQGHAEAGAGANEISEIIASEADQERGAQGDHRSVGYSPAEESVATHVHAGGQSSNLFTVLDDGDDSIHHDPQGSNGRTLADDLLPVVEALIRTEVEYAGDLDQGQGFEQEDTFQRFSPQ